MSEQLKLSFSVDVKGSPFITASIKSPSGSFSCVITGDKTDEGIEGAVGALQGAMEALLGREEADRVGRQLVDDIIKAKGGQS